MGAFYHVHDRKALGNMQGLPGCNTIKGTRFTASDCYKFGGLHCVAVYSSERANSEVNQAYKCTNTTGSGHISISYKTMNSHVCL